MQYQVQHRMQRRWVRHHRHPSPGDHMSAPSGPTGPEPRPKKSPDDQGRPERDQHRGSLPARAARSAVSAVLIVLTCILVPVALLTVWVDDIVLDTDRYVETVAPLATDPAIQDAAVRRITDVAAQQVDGDRAAAELANWLRSQGLPPLASDAVRNLGPQINSAVDQAVTRVATKVVHSDAFATVWEEANRAAHDAVVHALTGEGRGAVDVKDGTVSLDLGAVVDKVREDLVNAGLTPAEHIPDVNKEFVLFQSEQIAKVRDGAQLLDAVGTWLPVIVVLIGAGGVLLAHHRRRALAWTGLGAAFACLVVAIGLVIARRYYLDHLPSQVLSKPAAAAAFDTLVRFLRASLRTTIVLGVVIALGAYLIGPGRLPVAGRRLSERTADSAAGWAYGHQVHAGRVGAWTEDYRRWITLGALLVVALVFALWNRPTVLTVLLLVLILLAVLAVIALLAASGRAAATAAGREGGSDGPGASPPGPGAAPPGPGAAPPGPGTSPRATETT
jgi:hypothetical protein